MDVTAFLLVMVMTTHGASGSPSPQASTFCEGKNEGSYCQNCLQPVYCDGLGGIIEYGVCPQGEACAVSLGASYCTEHYMTSCSCHEAGKQCDAYDPYSVEHCLTSGPILIDACPDGEFCYYGECKTAPACVPGEWYILKPDCTSSVFCDETGTIISTISCSDNQYVDSDQDCALAPPPSCDGTCTGRCPNAKDCSKFVVCQGNSEIGSGDCPVDTFFDTEINNCASSGENCVVTDGCSFPEITTTMLTTKTFYPTTTTATERPGDISDE